MLKVVDYLDTMHYTLNMKRGERYVGIINGKRHWKALICGHPVPMYRTKRCWDCWKPEMGKTQIGKPKKVKIRGEDHHSWKGGRVINAGGYVYIRINGKYVLEHRLVMEKHLDRLLKPSEIVHHINHDKQDNRIENLMLFDTHSDHLKHEHLNGERKK